MPSPALGRAHWLEFHHECLAYKDPLSWHGQEPFHLILTITRKGRHYGNPLGPRGGDRLGWLSLLLTQLGRWWDWGPEIESRLTESLEERV